MPRSQAGSPGRLDDDRAHVLLTYVSEPYAPSRKGISQSALPYRRSVPNWLKLTKDDVEDQIVKLAKKGLTPSQIGTVLMTRCLHDHCVT